MYSNLHSSLLTPSPSENIIYSYVQGSSTTNALHASPLSPLPGPRPSLVLPQSPLYSQPLSSGSFCTALKVPQCMPYLWKKQRSPLIDLFHLNLFPFLLPPGRVNTSTSSDSSSAKTPEIYPLPTTATATFLTEACNIPHLDSRSHLQTGLPHSTLATLQSILLQNRFQMLTRLFHILKPSMTFQLLTMKLMVCKAYRAWLLPLPL